MLWNSIISTKGPKFTGLDIGDFYHKTPIHDYEYMSMPIKLFLQHTIQQYYLNSKAKNGNVYLRIRKAIYGLPQAGSLANKQLQKYLSPPGYFEWAHTPGLWKRISRQTTFTLFVGDFGFKYCKKKDAQHFIDSLLVNYDKVKEDWEGKL